MADAWRLRVGSAEDLDLVEPLWVAVHHRHVESMPALAPYVDDTDTWRARRKLYEDLLTLPDTLLLLAIVDERPVGYGLTHVMLSVLPDYRGTGLGSQLLERLESHLRALGVDDMILGALAGNTDAIRLYERRGYRPTWLYLSKLAGRDRESR
jgi:ribosomal protein S18 acetylase RimI-like enzyme